MNHVNRRLVALFSLSVLLGYAGVGCGAADDSEADSDTGGGDCDSSSFHEGSDSFPEDLEESMTPFFDCPSTFALPADARPYKSQGIVPVFADYLRYQAIQWVDASRLECCDLDEELTNCIEANYETGEGVSVHYRFEEIYLSSNEYSESRDVYELIDILLPAGTETWNALSVTADDHRSHSDETGGTSSSYTWEWAGSLLPSWPADYSVSATRTTGWGDISFTAQTNWSHPGCELVMESNNDDIVGSNPEIPFYSVALPGTLLEIKSGPTLQEAWLNDVCVGQVDETTWEVVGECE